MGRRHLTRATPSRLKGPWPPALKTGQSPEVLRIHRLLRVPGSLGSRPKYLSSCERLSLESTWFCSVPVCTSFSRVSSVHRVHACNGSLAVSSNVQCGKVFIHMHPDTKQGLCSGAVIRQLAAAVRAP